MTVCRLIVLILSVGLLSSCDFFERTQSNKVEHQAKAKSTLNSQDITQLINDFSLNAYEQLSKAQTQAEKLSESLSLLLRTPSSETLNAAKKQWRLAYSSYLKSQIYFYLPIKDSQEWVNKRIGYKDLAANIASFPIEGGYIDYMQGYPFSGLVNDLAINIDESTLIEQHGLADPSYASLGFHVLEFLLWGEDGKRPQSDYYKQKNQQEIRMVDYDEVDKNAPPPAFKVQNHLRRREMLRIVGERLSKDIHHIKQRWEPSNGYYAKLLTQSPSEKVLAAMFKASQKMLEQEFLEKRLKEGSSLFSQSTPDDVLALLMGLIHVYQLGSNDSPSTSGVLKEGLLFAKKSELAKSWQQDTTVLIGVIKLWKNKQNQKNKDEVIKQTIQVLQQVHNIANAFHIVLKKPKEQPHS